jgi:FlaA1/EpsC-like NDP-sugar epimerase/lipopolysaccharide/colanic/teichoic acid biosynthesis glycosyltransferase
MRVLSNLAFIPLFSRLRRQETRWKRSWLGGLTVRAFILTGSKMQDGTAGCAVGDAPCAQVSRLQRVGELRLDLVEMRDGNMPPGLWSQGRGLREGLMGIGKLHHRTPTPVHDISLLIGRGGDLTLMSAIIHAPNGQPRTSYGAQKRHVEWVWVDTIDEAQRVAHHAHIRTVVADPVICAAHDTLKDSGGRSIPIRPVSAEIERILGRASVQHGGGDTPSVDVDSRESRAYVGGKRAVDIIAGTLALVVLAIPVALVYALFCLAFGPSTFSVASDLVGRNGRPFRLRKLSFVPTTLAPDAARARFARSTNQVIDRFHLSLAPALVNVIAGQMSLVGPRPEGAAAIDRGRKISHAYPQRFVVEPGLVSLARVRFPYSDSPRDVRLALEYDLFYVKNRSPELDTRILGRAALLLAGDAYRTSLLSGRAIARMIGRGFGRLASSDTVRPARIASVAMPTDFEGTPLNLKPTLIVGAGEGGKLIIKELKRDSASGLWPVALVDDDPALLGARVNDVPVLGNTAAIHAVVDREHIETIVLAMPSASELDLHRIADAARETGVPLLTMPSIGGILTGDDATRLRVVPTSDLLGRPVVETDVTRSRAFLGGKNVLVTGAAGSIGREVVRQALRSEPATIYGLDINESDLYDLQQELRATPSNTRFVPIVASVTQPARLNKLMEQIRPQVVFHAAAYKHVPLMEDFPHEAIQSNIQGTWNVAQAAAKIGAERFVLVSTDKAVRPSSVMGASKRIAELVVRDIAASTGLSACAVRFGNVLGSRGSVIPLFEKQIAAGGPITITDKRMTRYFMTIPEAAGLIIEAGAFGDSGVIYMLDMGEPVAIVDVADRLIRLHGKRPGTDVEIKFTGLRPGEKMFEELSLDFEAARETGHPKIRILDEGTVAERQPAESMMRRLIEVIQEGTPEEIRASIMRKVMLADGVDTTLLSPLPADLRVATA